MTTRRWYVHGLPVPGYIPDGCTIDCGTGYANKMVFGPFSTAILAAMFLEKNMRVEKWKAVSVHSNRTVDAGTDPNVGAKG